MARAATFPIGPIESITPWVAPLVGAWIEINVGGHTSGVGCGSLLSWERGLKSDGSFGKHVRFARRSSRGSVD